jgi:DNA modification methylase
MNKIEFGDCRETMRRWATEGVKVQTCVTSPPYFGLRDYGHEGQIGLEQTPEEYISAMVEVFCCVRDVLADDGTLWLNIGDSYAGAGYSNHKSTGGTQREDGGKPRHLSNTGVKNKDLIGIPWMLAFALRADGWYLRQDIIWHKPNPMPESVQDRCTKAHEYIFLLSKSDRYFFDSEAIKEPAANAGKRISLGAKSMSRGQATGANVAASGNGLAEFYDVPETRNRRSVWTVTTKPYKGAHFATFPTDLIEPCILAGSRKDDIVLDPFMGSGTTAQVALQHGRQYLGCELNKNYEQLQTERINSITEELDRLNCQSDLFC